MEIKPVVKPLGVVTAAPITPVKPVAIQPVVAAPIIAPKVVSPVSVDTTAKDTEAKTESVVDVPKEERLGDIKQAVTKVEEKKTIIEESKKQDNFVPETSVSDETPKSKKKNKAKISNNLKPSAKAKEVTEGEIIKKDPPTKEVEGIVINYEDYRKDEIAFVERLKTIKEKHVYLEGIETDEMKCLEKLWEQGKGAVERKLGEYVLSYDIYEDILSKIFVDEIIHVVVNRYYDDVTLNNPKYLGCYYHVYHKGKRVFDKINTRTYEYLKSKKLIPEEFICTIDVNTRIRFFGKKIEDINQAEFDRELKNKLRVANRFDKAYLNLDIEQLES